MGSQQHPKGNLKTNPEIHLSPHGPTIWPKAPQSLHFMAQNSHFIDFGYHFASFLKGICDPKAAKQESGKAANLSSILNMSSRVGGSASHINIVKLVACSKLCTKSTH